MLSVVIHLTKITRTGSMSYDQYLTVSPFNNGSFLSQKLDPSYPHHSFFVQFFDEDGMQVIPSQGTLGIQASEDGICWGDVTDGTLDISQQNYQRPLVMYTGICYVRAIFADVNPSDAASARVVIQSFSERY